VRRGKGLITGATMAMYPVYHSVYQTILLDSNRGKIFSEKTIMELISEACMEDGASYDGKIQAVRHALPYLRKTPLIINKEQQIYAFPTMSPTKFDCIWLFHLHIKKFTSFQEYTIITFINGTTLKINCSIKVLMRQRERAAVTMSYFAASPNVPARELSSTSYPIGNGGHILQQVQATFDHENETTDTGQL
jgi:competence protein ComK